MTAKTKDEIKAFFETGDKPIESQFIDFIDSYVDKSGPIGDIETVASGGATGFAYVSAMSTGKILTTAQLTTKLNITVSTTALASAVASNAITNAFATTAQAASADNTTKIINPAVLYSGITSRIATTAQAASADNTMNLMSPQLVNQRISDSLNDWTYLSSQNLSGSTSRTFSGIPNTAKEIEIFCQNGSYSSGVEQHMTIDIGDAGGIETSGYTSGAQASAGNSFSTAEFLIGWISSSSGAFFSAKLFLADAASNLWLMSAVGHNTSSAEVVTSSGSKALSDVLTQLRVGTVNNSTFDSGTVYLRYR